LRLRLGSKLRSSSSERGAPTTREGGQIHFACARIQRLTEAPYIAIWWERARDKSEKIRAKLGRPGFIAANDPEGFPDKPKWMRWRTYERLKAEDERLLGVTRMALIG
jgi:hypothetical protein